MKVLRCQFTSLILTMLSIRRIKAINLNLSPKSNFSYKIIKQKITGLDSREMCSGAGLGDDSCVKSTIAPEGPVLLTVNEGLGSLKDVKIA